jgi:YesN/AraC family two-component response regulator
MSSSAKLSGANDAWSTLTVLFVDDEEAVVRMIKRAMASRSDLVLLTATNGADALDVLGSQSVDVLVSDIDMPKMSGLDLVKIARRDFPATLRILLTGAGTMDRALSAINDGEVVRFFNKPFEVDAFLRALGELGDRIFSLRRERHAETQRARTAEFLEWVEKRHPHALTLPRDPEGVFIVDLRNLSAYLNTAPSEIRAVIDLTR